MSDTTPVQHVHPRLIAAWLHGYDTGHAVGHTTGTQTGFRRGYDAGYAAGIAEGIRREARDASEKWRAYLDLANQRRGPGNRLSRFGPAKPLPSYTQCLASWGLGDEHHHARPAAVRAAA